MKKLVCAAIVAASMCAMADEAKKDAAPAAAAVAKPTAPARPQMTEEQRAQMRERRQKFMAERKAAMESKMLEVVKKYVPEEAKAKELQEAMIGARRPMTNRPRPMPKAAKPAEAAPAAK